MIEDITPNKVLGKSFLSIGIKGWSLRRCKNLPRFSTNQGSRHILAFYFFLKGIHLCLHEGLKGAGNSRINILAIYCLLGNLFCSGDNITQTILFIGNDTVFPCKNTIQGTLHPRGSQQALAAIFIFMELS
ncbi:Uncharacterised protein [Streptococcus pneumoniae]|nr:Uncharacterised protein [Streptococcus pneumoniae]